MQTEGTPKFLRYHSASVKCVAFSPKDRYLFASGGNEGKVNLYSCSNSLSHHLLITYQLSNVILSRTISGVRFTSDGRRILCATTSRRLTVLDVERGEQILCYDNCAFSGRDKVPLAADPYCPHFAVCSCVNGKGLTLFDLRMPLPLDFVFDLHSSVIRDISFLNNSWPFMKSNESGLVSLSCDGVCKITTVDGRFLHFFEVGHMSNSIATTPEAYGSNKDNGFNSLMMIAGDSLSGYRPDLGIKEKQIGDCDSRIIYNKLKYTSNGSLLYAACEDGKVKRFRRYPDRHQYIGDVLVHKGDVYDLDISPYDEFLVTASKDKSVGVLCLGPPNHGWTGYCQLT